MCLNVNNLVYKSNVFIKFAKRVIFEYIIFFILFFFSLSLSFGHFQVEQQYWEICLSTVYRVL